MFLLIGPSDTVFTRQYLCHEQVQYHSVHFCFSLHLRRSSLKVSCLHSILQIPLPSKCLKGRLISILRRLAHILSFPCTKMHRIQESQIKPPLTSCYGHFNPGPVMHSSTQGKKTSRIEYGLSTLIDVLLYSGCRVRAHFQ